VRNQEGKRQLGKPRRRCENNIKMGLEGLVWDVVDWIDLAQDMDQYWVLVNTAMNFTGFCKMLGSS
jgi:hypothetical protein